MDEILKKIDEEIKEQQYIYDNEPACCIPAPQGMILGLEKAKEITLSEQKEPCEYTLEDEDSNTWECNKCGELWQLISGAPKDNNMNYCPSCGRPLNQLYTDTDEVFNRR